MTSTKYQILKYQISNLNSIEELADCGWLMVTSREENEGMAAMEGSE